MTPNIFNEALMATARVACCAGLVSIVACQEKTTSTDDTAETDVPDTDETDTEQTDTEETDTESQIIVPEEPTFEACMDAIEAGFNEPSFDTSSLLDCCLLTTEQVGYDALYSDPEYADLNENCCNLIAESGEFSSACTPWGPPTPPSMRKIAKVVA